MTKGYKLQNGCWNCGDVFVVEGYDVADEFYCTSDAPTRPHCGSDLMNECFFPRDKTTEEGFAEYEEWCEWERNQQVSSCGICPKWRKL